MKSACTDRPLSAVTGQCWTKASLALLGWCLAASTSAAQLVGDVVGVSDGDTVTVLDASQTQHKIRVSGIDAPEQRQPFGNRSRQNLAKLVFRKRVVIEWNKRDRYGRIVGKILVDGQDAGLTQVAAGFAWHYKAYASEQSAEDQSAYALAEETARKHRLGLWNDAAPLPPWDFRRSRRSS